MDSLLSFGKGPVKIGGQAAVKCLAFLGVFGKEEKGTLSPIETLSLRSKEAHGGSKEVQPKVGGGCQQALQAPFCVAGFRQGLAKRSVGTMGPCSHEGDSPYNGHPCMGLMGWREVCVEVAEPEPVKGEGRRLAGRPAFQGGPVRSREMRFLQDRRQLADLVAKIFCGLDFR
jgi:hypothetical protein